MVKSKKLHCLIVIILSFLLSLSISWITDDVNYGIKDNMILLFGIGNNEYKITDVLFQGYQVTEEDVITANCDDGQIRLPSLEHRIVNLKIYLKEPLKYNTQVTVYYSDIEEGYTEEQAIYTTFMEKDSTIDIPICKNAAYVRVDLGCYNGERFVFDKIVVNQTDLWSTSSIYVYWMMSWSILFIMLYRKSKLVMLCKNRIYDVIDNDDKKISVVFVFVLMMLIAFLYKDYLIGNKNYLFDDIGTDSYYQTYPYQLYTARDIQSGNGWKDHWNYTNSLGNSVSEFKPNVSNWYLCMGQENVVYMMGINQILKVFFAGIFFFLYLRKMNIQRWWSFTFALCYAFCAHSIIRGSWPSYPAEVMLVAIWLYGFEFWRKDKSKWGVFFLTTTFFYWNTSGYLRLLYTLIFTVYVVFRIYVCEEKIEWKQFIKSALGYIIVLTLALIVSGTDFSKIIYNGVSSDRFARNTELIHSNNLGIISQWKVLCTAWLRTIGTDIVGVLNYVGSDNLLEAPAFYCGIISIVILPVACLTTQKKNKIFYIIAFIVVMAYVTFVPVRFLANGFSREDSFKLSSFWVIVLIIYISATECNNFISNKCFRAKMFIVTLVFINVLSVVMILPNIDKKAFCISLIIADIYCILIVLYKLGLITQSTLKITVLLIVVGELCLTSYKPINNRVTIGNNNRYEDGTIEAVKMLEDDTDFYRIDKQYISTFLCDSLYQNYRGTKAYIGGTGDRTSTINFYEFLGMPKTELNRYLFGFESSTLINTIMNVKYILSRSDVIGNYGYNYVTENNGIKIYENTYALPMGYTYDKYILFEDFMKLDMDSRRKVLFKACVVNEPIVGVDELDLNKIKKYEFPKEYLIDVETILNDTNIDILLNNKVENMTTILHVAINNVDKEVIYIGCHTDKGSKSFCNAIKSGLEEYIMEYSDDNITKLSIPFDNHIDIEALSVYQIPSDEYYNEYMNDCNKLIEDSMEMESIDENSIKGKVLCNKSKVLTFAIPFDSNWHIYVDGKRENLYTTNIGMMGCTITEGEHQISLEYYSENNVLKQVLMICCILLTYIMMRVKKERKKEII